MTVLENVRIFLETLAPRAVCDDCIADRLKLSVRQHANRKTRFLAETVGFDRRVDVCCLCRRTKKVIKALK